MKKVIALGMSGGVDSSMALQYLKKEWNHIVGANHIVWHGVKCSSPEVIGRAAKLCQRENIPFYALDITKEFKEKIADNFIASYLAGKTPNPCVICNPLIKFTFFYDKLKEVLLADKILDQDDELFYATGHYVRLYKDEKGKLFLRKAADLSKDQSYMLYRLPQQILSRTVFPTGEFYKKEITAEAIAEGFDFENVKESQDICFIEGSYGDFIQAQVPIGSVKPGNITDTKGNYLGKHRGYIYYTTGQRKGLSLGNGPWFVIKVLPEENIVVVGREEEQGEMQFKVKNLNWFINPAEVAGKLTAKVKVRYNSPERPCTVIFPKNDLGEAETVDVILSDKTVITQGQSAVFYQDDIVLGGGIIC